MTKNLETKEASHAKRDINLFLNAVVGGSNSKIAKDEIVRLYDPLIKKVAYKSFSHYIKKSNSNNYTFEDFYHEAIIGFLNSLSHFDVDYGVAIHGLARPYMEEQLNNFKFSINSTVKISSTLKKHLGKINQVARCLRKEGKKINQKILEEIATNLNIKDKSKFISQYQAYTQQVNFFSTDEEGNNSSYIDLNPEEIDQEFTENIELNILEHHDKSKLREKIKSLLKNLDSKEKLVLQKRFLQSDNSLTLCEISKLLDLSIERVRQIESKALEKLKISGGVELKKFLSN